MNLFKKKQETVAHVSNISLEQMMFHDHFDQKIAIITIDAEPKINGAVTICLTNDSLTQAMDDLKKQHPRAELAYTQSVLGLSLDFALQQNLALIMHGFGPMPLIINAKDLEPIRDIVDSFCIMYACARNQMPLDQAYSLLEKKIFYFIGEPLTPETKSFGVEVMPRQKEGKDYQSIKLFLNEESANQYNKEKHPVSKSRLGDLYGIWKGMYGLIIEPHKNFWVEFGVEDVEDIGS